MNKTQIVELVVKETNLKRKEAEAAVNATIAAIEGALVAGEKVQIAGIGTFEVKTRGARTGINPQNGEKIEIAACKYPAFSASKTLKAKLN